LSSSAETDNPEEIQKNALPALGNSLEGKSNVKCVLSQVLFAMDGSLSELYQEIIIEHNRAPRNKAKLPAATRVASGYHPSCGDEIAVFVEIYGDGIKNIAFDGEGCAISQASASIMTELLSGKSIGEACKIIDEVCAALGNQLEDIPLGHYGEVAALCGVKKFPMRIKCATLAWHAAKEAILGDK
jgi:nitrogen fixation NifU-like protein